MLPTANLLSLKQCYTSTLASIKEKGDTRCSPILPYPKEMKLPRMIEHKAPKNIHFSTNYKQKLDGVQCQSIFNQFTQMALNESLELGKVVKPRFMIAPMKTNIQMINSKNAFSITAEEFNSIQEQSKHLPIYHNWMDDDEITRPFNQGLCGSCWAVSAANCLSDVFVVSKKVKKNPNLSTTYILSCLPQGQCNGGDPSQVAQDLAEQGVVSNDCIDYSWCTSTGCGGDPLKHFDSQNVNQYVPPCQCSIKIDSNVSKKLPKYYAENPMAICIPPKLDDFSSIEAQQIKYYLSEMYGNVDSTKLDLSSKSVKEIQALVKYQIYTYGPVVGGFHVFKNFFKGNYHETNDIYVETCSYSGIEGVDYDDIERDWVGSHAVVIVGWGQDKIEDEIVDYWLVRNSWGRSWGLGGLFKMAMYGDDPTKKYQNRASQFEYPSIVNTDQGIGITGGLIIYKAGNIDEISSEAPNTYVSPEQNSTEQSPSSDQPPSESPVQSACQVFENTQSKPPRWMDHYTQNGGQTLLSFIILLAFLYALYMVYSNQDDNSAMIILKTILILFITGLLLQISV
jgi:C1A family cysteine protease